jgi:3-oxoacyl-[acyl-carrier-protein] synthase III
MPGILSIGWYVPTGRRDAAMIARDYRLPREAVTAFGLASHSVAAEHEHPSFLAAGATRAALAAAGLSADAVDLLIFAGMTREYPAPWVSAFGVLHHLGATRAAGFDLANRCTGLHDALWVAAALVRGGSFRTVVVCAGDRFDYLLGPPRQVTQVSDVAYSAGGGAAIVSNAASNDLVAFSHFTNEDLSLHNQLCPRIGGSRHPFTEGSADGGQRWQNTMKVGEASRLAGYLKAADRHNITSVCRDASFDAVDFVACSPLDVPAQLASLVALGIGPEKTLLTTPHLGHMGPADSVVALGVACAVGRRIGRRVVLSTRSALYSNAIGLRAHGASLEIGTAGVGLDLDLWRDAKEGIAPAAAPQALAGTA